MRFHCTFVTQTHLVMLEKVATFLIHWNVLIINLFNSCSKPNPKLGFPPPPPPSSTFLGSISRHGVGVSSYITNLSDPKIVGGGGGDASPHPPPPPGFLTMLPIPFAASLSRICSICRNDMLLYDMFFYRFPPLGIRYCLVNNVNFNASVIYLTSIKRLVNKQTSINKTLQTQLVAYCSMNFITSLIFT